MNYTRSKVYFSLARTLPICRSIKSFVKVVIYNHSPSTSGANYMMKRNTRLPFVLLKNVHHFFIEMPLN